jgi:hypothetical protein
MLKSPTLNHVGLGPQLHIQWARRFNVSGGDNGLGKSFLLELAWWALTRTRAGPPALPGWLATSPDQEPLMNG